ncbi:MAG: histidine kinase [Cyclobacteriaceae bacterium]|jgi:sensor histidine kinase YesM|nr:histidine kinase [Cyclobacteriaceae bacterium]
MKQIELLLDRIFAHHRWVMHVLYWLVILLLYVIFFGRKESNYLQTLFFVGLLMPITLGTTYFLNYYLVPRYLMRDRFGIFLLYLIYTLIASLFLEMMISMITFIVIAEVRIKNMSPASFDFFFLLTSLLMVVFLGVAIKMILHWRKSKEDYQKLMRDKVETELKFLKAQLNPHFLFNTLNNLYYLSTEKSDKAPQAILALSEILDYVLHAGKSVLVPLREELKQVDNYIALELLRYEDRVSIETNYSGDLDRHKIGPMILITLIENAFKHGVMPVAGKAWINFRVECKEYSVVISMSNSTQVKVSGSGIGLANLKSQLNYLYNDNFVLTVNRESAEFLVKMELPRL